MLNALFGRDSPRPTREARERKETRWLQSIGRASKAPYRQDDGPASDSLALFPSKLVSDIGAAPSARATTKPVPTSSLRISSDKALARAPSNARLSPNGPRRRKISGTFAQKPEVVVTDGDSPDMATYSFISVQDAGESPTDTRTLAMQLKELSLAHADHLIADEDYRTLRQAVFERHVKASGEKRDAAASATGSLRPTRSTSTLGPRPLNADADLHGRGTMSLSPKPQQQSSNASTHSKAASTKTHRSFASSLRRKLPSKTSQRDWDHLHQKHMSKDTETLHEDVRDQATGLRISEANFRQSLLPPLPLTTSNAEVQPESASMSRGASTLSAMSGYSNSSDRYSQLAPSFLSASNRMSIASRPSMRSAKASYVSHSFETDNDHHSSASSHELATEIKQLEAERDRMLASFGALIDAARDRYASPSARSVNAATISPSISQWETMTPTSSPISSRASKATSDKHRTPSSFSMRLKSSRASLLSKASESPLSPLADFPKPPTLGADLNFDSPEEREAYLSEAAPLREKSEKVRLSYNDRLHYLQAKMEGARIREDLPR